MRFSDLSIQEKAAVIRLGIGSGLRSLLLIEDFYNSIDEGSDNTSSVLGNRRSSNRDDGNKRNERRMTIRDWLRGNKNDVNSTLNNIMYVDNGGKPYVNGSVASMDRLLWVPSVDTDTGQVNSRPNTYYYDNEGLLHMYPGNHVEPVKRMSQEEIADFFWLMENPYNVGFNLDNGMYYKYRDPNGKDWDVGPGLVIGKAIEDKPYYTKEELDMAAYKYHMDAMDKLAPLYDKKYGSGAFGNIDDRGKLVASDVMYRVGLNGVNPDKWPGMFDAINSGNTAMMLQLSRSKFKDKNNVLNYDNARVKRLGEYLYPGEFEYIFKNSLDPNIRVRKVELKRNGGYLSSTDPEYPPVIQKVNRSKADFVQRLKDPNRAYIQDWDNPDNIATHKLSWADDGIVYPLVLNVNGRLVDFSRPPYDIWAGYDNAVRNGDTIHMTPLEAEWFTTHYKDYYPGFDEYKKGGSIHIKPENRGKFNATKKRTGKTTEELTHSKNPLTRKRAIFAQNARKWHHKHPDGGLLNSFIVWPQILAQKLSNKYKVDYANNGAMYGYPTIMDVGVYALSPYINYNGISSVDPYKFYDDTEYQRRSAFAKYFNVSNNDLNFNPDDYIIESQYKPLISSDNTSKYYTIKGDKKSDFVDMFGALAGEFKVDKGSDLNGEYYSMYDNWDLDPFGHLFISYGDHSSRNKGLKNHKPVEFYDRIYKNENINLYNLLELLYKKKQNNIKLAKALGGYLFNASNPIKPFSYLPIPEVRY